MKQITFPPTPLMETIRMLAEQIQPMPSQFSIPPHILIVGGFVRDGLLNLTPTDADVEVYGAAYEDTKLLLQKIFPNRVLEIGKSFGIFKVTTEYGDIDISLPREESKTGVSHTDFRVTIKPDMSPVEALRRRDFTINAIALNPLTGELIDPFNGQSDLEQGVLHIVDPKTFTDDPLRLYRAMQFVSRFTLTVTLETLLLLQSMVQSGSLSTLSKERITQEWKKLLLGTKPSLGLKLARNTGLIQNQYPELWELVRTPQDPIWHPEGSVWNHTLLSLDATSYLLRHTHPNMTEEEQVQALLGVLLHDIGKPYTTTVEQGRIRSHGHEVRGEALAQKFLSSFSFSKTLMDAVISIVQEHMSPRRLHASVERQQMSELQYINAVRRLLKQIQPASWRALLIVTEADLKGRGQSSYDDPCPLVGHFITTVEQRKLENANHPLISGQDIIQISTKVGVLIAPGPEFGKLIDTIEHERDTGMVATKQEALILLENLLKNSTT